MKFFYPILIVHWLHSVNSKGKENSTTILPVFSNPVWQYGPYMPIYGQLGYIIVYQKENRRTLSGDCQTVP